MCDHPGVTPGTASAAIKHPFFGTWTSETTATVMAKRYRLWPCRNRPREGPETLAKIETLAMGFFGHPESQVGPLPRVGLYARVSTPHQNTTGMQLREFLETPSLAGGPLLSKRASPDPGGARRETVYSTLPAREIRPSSRAKLTDSGPAGSLSVIFHTVAAHAPSWYSRSGNHRRRTLQASG